MQKNKHKVLFLCLLLAVFSVCSVIGFNLFTVRAEEKTAIEITGINGGAQEHLSRYLVRLQSDVPFEYAGDDMPTITVVVDGEEKTVESWNDKEAKSITLLVPFDVAPFNERTELTVKAGTLFHNYEIASDVTIIMQGYDLLLNKNQSQ